MTIPHITCSEYKEGGGSSTVEGISCKELFTEFLLFVKILTPLSDNTLANVASPSVILGPEDIPAIVTIATGLAFVIIATFFCHRYTDNGEKLELGTVA